MRRVFVAAALTTTLGCQTQNPFAAIGPATVPAPPAHAAASPTGVPLPYVPASASAPSTASTPRGLAPQPSGGRLSVSADGPLRSVTSPAAIVAEPADREPIRIVESSSPAIRTATAPNSAQSPPPNSLPAGQPSSYAPPSASPGIRRTRGFAATPASSPTVSPAGYQQPIRTFTETPAASGQWRAR